MSDIEIPDQEWWNEQTLYFQKDFLKRLKRDIEWYGPKGDSRVDGNALCPRCSSPYYHMLRLASKKKRSWGQPRSDESHYYGKKCYTCGYSYDPRAESKDKKTVAERIEEMEKELDESEKEHQDLIERAKGITKGHAHECDRCKKVLEIIEDQEGIEHDPHEQESHRRMASGVMPIGGPYTSRLSRSREGAFKKIKDLFKEDEQ